MSEHTVEQPTAKRLERSRSDRMLAGVSGGLARYFEIHPAFFRVGFVVLTLLGGAGVLIYAAAVLVIPDEGKEDSIATAALRQRRERPWPLIGFGLVSVALVVLLWNSTLWPSGDGWVLVLLAGAAILWITHRGRTNGGDSDAAALAADDSRRLRRWVKGLAIAAASIVALAIAAGAIFLAVFNVHVGNGVGDRTYVPAGAQDLQDSYKLGIGDMRLDLRNVRLPIGETRLEARVDVGSLRVIVPSDAALKVRAEAEAGRVDVLGSTSDGHNADRSIDEPGNRVLVLEAHVGAGNVDVTRAVR
jgi:phage shock protein PspC (stress-responsive transcriptional regulator)